MTKATTPLQALDRVQAALEAAQAYPEGQHPPEVLNELADSLQAAPESYRQHPGMDEWMQWAQSHTERRQHARFFELLKQLDGVKTSLERAQTSASTDPQSRYFFDYQQAQQDITTIEQGIRRYLTPARAQPRAVQPLSASYQREHLDD